jgi:hypothetical protein
MCIRSCNGGLECTYMTHFRRAYGFSLTLPAPLSRQLKNTTMPPRLGFLNRPTRLEMWALQKLTNLETYCHARMRRETFPRYLFAVSLLPVFALAACTGLLLLRTMTLEEVNKVCEQRFGILMPKLTSNPQEFLKDNLFSKLIPGLMHITSTQSLPSL